MDVQNIDGDEGTLSRWLSLAEDAAPVPHEWVRRHRLVGHLVAAGWSRKAGLWWLPPPHVSGRSAATAGETLFLGEGEPTGAEWDALCRRSPHIPWALWMAIRALQADTSQEAGRPAVAVLSPPGALATVRGTAVRLRGPLGGSSRLLRLGGTADGALTPGETLEEQLGREASARVTARRVPGAAGAAARLQPAFEWGHAAVGQPADARQRTAVAAILGQPLHRAETVPLPTDDVDRAGLAESWSAAPPRREPVAAAIVGDPDSIDLGVLPFADDDAFPAAEELVHVAAANWDDVMAVEVERARRWLDADPVLGRVCLLGPLSFRTYRTVQLRRDEGYLSHRFAMTAAGWWRLAYLAGQGVGGVERRRARVLGRATPSRRRELAHGRNPSAAATSAPTPMFSPRHLLLTQRLCLEYMRQGATPVGVEVSALGTAIQVETGFRPDALLVQRDGTLVWLEVNLRPASRLAREYHKYRYIERRHARDVCLRLGRPVLLHLTFGRSTRRIIYRPGELYGTEVDRA